jgi:CO/xanthine dehydrogenase FAD-binding subunit
MRILHEFAYERPRTIDEALALLAKHGGRLSPLAGGTDLVVNMKMRGILQLTEGAGTPQARWPAARRVPAIQRPAVVMSLADLPELGGIDAGADRVRIGPLATMARIAACDDLPAAVLAVRDAAAIMGSPLIRNLGTIGGNLINARPAADTAVALLCLDAKLELASAGGRRRVDIASFFTGPGTSVRRPDELLVDVEAPCGPGEGSAYLRMGNRRQLEIALVGVAAWLRLDPASGTVAEARIALGAVAPTPVRAGKAARLLVGQPPEPEAFARAAREASAEVSPINDFRGSAAYRHELVKTLVARALEAAAKRAAGPGGAR